MICDSIEKDRSFLTRFSGTGETDDTEYLTLLDFKVYAVEHLQRLAVRVECLMQIFDLQICTHLSLPVAERVNCPFFPVFV